MLRQVMTENGALRGLPGADPRITVFKGVPFAAPPVGKNRWRAPQPCENWEGVRDAFAFGPISMQDTPGIGDGLYDREWHVDPDIPNSEDCLYLNVWTPAKTPDENLPVLLWIYGGGFQWGYTAEMEFDGERLSRRGIIVVSAAYRLGAFGFLAHPDLTKEQPQSPGNFGLLDQQCALRWVQRNIAAFGGDPSRITLAGQSAGGGSVLQQMTCEENYGSICGAVILSGMIRALDEENDLFRPLSLAKAEEKGKDFLAFLGVSTIEEARELDAVFIRDRYAQYAQDHQRMFPIEDGIFCKGDTLERFIAGDRARVPVISGNTGDEFTVNGINIVEKTVKETFLKTREADPACPPLYYYRFDPDIPGWDHPGTFHSCDLWFFFETLGKCWRPFTGRHFELARQMCDYFANFVKTRDPNGNGWNGETLPLWKPYSRECRSQMDFLSEGSVPGEERPDGKGKQAVNPYLPPWEFIPDGEPYVFGDRVYVYGSHDAYDAETFCAGDYVCWSAPVNDPGNFRYEGVIYPKTEDPMNADGHMCLYAPDVTVGPDGRYYLFYVLDKVSVVSVAVSDTPAGRYRFHGYVHYEDGTRLGEREGDEPQFDPGVLTEGDLTYLYTGFCGAGDRTRHGAMMTVLDRDMLTVRHSPVFVAPGAEYSRGTGYEGHAYFEAASIRKRGNTYYFIYSSEVMHELCYATGKHPEGPFTYGGVLVSNCDLGIDTYKRADESVAFGANNHGSMVQIGSDWYIFYHRHTNGTWFSRQGCAEKLTFREDGSIEQAELTSCGLGGDALPDRGEYPAYIACCLFTEKHSTYVEYDAPKIVLESGRDHDPLQNGSSLSASGPYAFIRRISDGTGIGFKYFDAHGVTGLRIKTRGYANGFYEVRCRYNGEVIGRIPTDGTNIWTERECTFKPGSFPDGKQALWLTFRSSDSSSLGAGSLLSIELLH